MKNELIYKAERNGELVKLVSRQEDGKERTVKIMHVRQIGETEVNWGYTGNGAETLIKAIMYLHRTMPTYIQPGRALGKAYDKMKNLIGSYDEDTFSLPIEVIDDIYVSTGLESYSLHKSLLNIKKFLDGVRIDIAKQGSSELRCNKKAMEILLPHYIYWHGNEVSFINAYSSPLGVPNGIMMPNKPYVIYKEASEEVLPSDTLELPHMQLYTEGEEPWTSVENLDKYEKTLHGICDAMGMRFI